MLHKDTAFTTVDAAVSADLLQSISIPVDLCFSVG